MHWEREFAFKVYARGDCWEWRGSHDRYGYGWFVLGGEMLRAHRVAYLIAKGYLPPDLIPEHLCRHPWCVRPSHLEAATQRTNVIRGDSPAGHHYRQQFCSRGHRYDGLR